MKENLIKCTIRTSSGLIVKCELSLETIEKLKSKNLVSISQD